MITIYSNTISVTTDIFPFEFTVKTNNAGVSTSTQFQLPLVSSLALDAVVDWGDGNTDTITTFNQAETLHTYASAGTYTIKITGDLSGWQFANGGDKLKMLNVVTWGVLNISVNAGFFGCTNLTCSATDAPVITSDSLGNYFRGCTSFNGAIGNWNVLNVTVVVNMLFSATNFNQDIGLWNVSNVTNFTNFMFGKTNLNYSAANLDSIYMNWSLLTLNPNLTITFGTIKHTAAGTAGRLVLTSSPNNWSITDGGI